MLKFSYFQNFWQDLKEKEGVNIKMKNKEYQWIAKHPEEYVIVLKYGIVDLVYWC